MHAIISLAVFIGLSAAAPHAAKSYQRTAPTKAIRAPSPSTSASGAGLGNTYTYYSGNGSPSEGWPAETDWLDFSALWSANEPIIAGACSQFSEADNSASETSDIESAIMSVGASTGVDPRVILAIVMQESNGCVRVPTTDNGVVNPGLMQSHDGSGTCDPNGVATNPCPDSEITQMIEDGTSGTSSGDGLEQCFSQATGSGNAQKYYQAAVIYNSGSLPENLSDNTATPCYASDVANRLTGWTSADNTCTA